MTVRIEARERRDDEDRNEAPGMSEKRLEDHRIAVLAGGWSDEREISMDSGKACAKALREAGFATVELIDVASESFIQEISSGKYDVAFVAMHGIYGEDGCVQGLLEILHLPYTFSGVLASAAGTAKEITKLIYKDAGVPTPKGMVIEPDASPSEAELKAMVEELGLPLFVKPTANGSSYGITRVTEEGQLKDAIKLACEEGSRALVEEAIEGTEITAPVLGNDDAQALPIVEIVTGADFYDREVKYEPSELHHVIPARIDEAAYKRAQEYAVAAHRALGCKGCSRSDFIVREDGEPVILETNTIPGMTETSLMPDSARHAGIEFPELCRRFVELALEDADKK